MDDNTFNNWVKIRDAMKSQGMTETKFYDRACICSETREDPGIPGYDEYYQHFLKILDIA